TRIGDIVDGSSNTLLVGEVTGGFGLPNGDYVGHNWFVGNLSDTYTGINGEFSVPGGADSYSKIFQSFSSFHPGGCHFAFSDGSVHFLNESIDAQVLAAMASRNGHELVQDRL